MCLVIGNGTCMLHEAILGRFRMKWDDSGQMEEVKTKYFSSWDSTKYFTSTVSAPQEWWLIVLHSCSGTQSMWIVALRSTLPIIDLNKYGMRIGWSPNICTGNIDFLSRYRPVRVFTVNNVKKCLLAFCRKSPHIRRNSAIKSIYKVPQ